jgi:VWFA-related protein
VTDLGQEHFRVLEDGRPRPISVFHHGDVPVTFGLVVDRSTSMRGKRPALVAAVSTVLRLSRADDELFAVGFSDDVSFALPADRPFTHDPDDLVAALSGMPAGGMTALYDGVAEALRHVLERGDAERRVLVVVSDGGDNASRETFASVLALAHRSHTVIYAIGLMGTPPADDDEDRRPLRRLARDTGGMSIFPRSPEDIVAAATRVARDVREQYTLGFVPGPRADGRTFRRIEVKVEAAGLGRIRARTRSGYVAADTP